MNWYYAEHGQQMGPIAEEQLQQLFQSGRIRLDTLVWHEGMADWKPYEQATAPAGPAPAIPPGAPFGTAGNEVVCAECGNVFPAAETVRFGKTSVCAACKPVFLQKLSEGAHVNTGRLDFAGIFTRFAAVFLDGILLFVVNLGTNALLGLFFAHSVRTIPAGGHFPAGFIALQIFFMAVNVAIGLTYETVLIGKYGATLGKMACKIKVVTADGGRVTYARALGRYFAKMLSGIICLIGYIIAIFDDEKRALHDHICNTRVVMK